MKTYFTVFTLFISFFIICVFQTTSNAQDKEVYKGKFALQFQIGQNFTLSSFQGSVLSGKYNFSENDAVRLGLSIGVFKSDNNTLNGISNPSSTTGFTQNVLSNNYGILLQYIRNNYLDNNLNFYFGGGPTFSYGVSRNETLDMQSNSIINSNNYSKDYGISACLGIEWYFNKSMSLSAQYGIAFDYSEAIQNSNSADNNTQVSYSVHKSTGYQINPNSVLFGLSVYF